MKELYKALAAFQQEVPTIKKNATGYGYKFADLEEINNIIKPLLKKNGLGYAQPLDGTSIKTILFHIESGETLESTTEIPQGVQLKGQNEFQVLGSAITYLRRYSLSSMLGLVTDEDADAAGEQTKESPAATLARAKKVINEKLIEIGITNPIEKTDKIELILHKTTIDTISDANKVMDVLEEQDVQFI